MLESTPHIQEREAVSCEMFNTRKGASFLNINTVYMPVMSLTPLQIACSILLLGSASASYFFSRISPRHLSAHYFKGKQALKDQKDRPEFVISRTREHALTHISHTDFCQSVVLACRPPAHRLQHTRAVMYCRKCIVLNNAQVQRK